MFKILIGIIAIAFAVNSASAEIIGIGIPNKQEVYKTIMEAIPIAAPSEMDACYEAMKNDGFYKIHSPKVRIVCSKNQLTRVWVQ